MSAEDHKALFRYYFNEGTNKGDLSVVEKVFAADYIHHDPANVDAIGGMEDVRRHITTLRSAFPDVAFHIQQEIVDGDDIVVRWNATGTHTGDYFGIPATGKSFNITGMNHWQMGADGKTVEGWVSRDDMGLMRQLGLMG